MIETAKLLELLTMLETIKKELNLLKQAECNRMLEIKQILQQWQRADHIRLHAGEMTAQEMRSIKAVVKAIEANIMRVIDHERVH